MQSIALFPIPLEELKKELMDGLREELALAAGRLVAKEDFIKSDEVCKILNISKVTLTEWRRRGLIKYHKIGSRVFFNRAEILETGRIKP